MPDLDSSIRVVSITGYRPVPGETVLYIGRGAVPRGVQAEHAQMGNPFVVGRGYARGEAVKAYETHLRGHCRTGGPLRAQVLRLARRLLAGERLALLCYCAPRPCHGDVLRRAILGYARNFQEEKT